MYIYTLDTCNHPLAPADVHPVDGFAEDMRYCSTSIGMKSIVTMYFEFDSLSGPRHSLRLQVMDSSSGLRRAGLSG